MGMFGPVLMVYEGQVSVGGVMSRTRTVKLHTVGLPDLSDTVQLTLVLPTLKVEPELGLHTCVGTSPELSVAARVKISNAVFLLASSVMYWSGHCTTGSSRSATATAKKHCASLPEKSYAVHVTTVVPMKNLELGL